MLVGSAVILITGTAVLEVLSTSMILFAKNSAINTMHEQARTGVMQVMQDIHSAVSLPQLLDANQNPVSGGGPAAGISFQMIAGGPFKVNANAAANQSTVQILTNGYTPVVGQVLIIEAIPIEQTITGVSVSGNVSTLTLAANLGQTVTVSSGSNSYNVVALINNRVTYVVNNGVLNYYGINRTGKYSTVASNVTSPTPFSIPNTPAGALYYRFVAAINLSTADPTAIARNYKSANMFLNAQVPYRSRITTYQ
jgi:hypothetical protein